MDSLLFLLLGVSFVLVFVLVIILAAIFYLMRFSGHVEEEEKHLEEKIREIEDEEKELKRRLDMLSKEKKKIVEEG